ncbi:MAG: SulP family inorganic anion transporter [Coriobacteriia bacterium]
MGETITPKTSKAEALIESAAAAVERLPGSVGGVTGRDAIAGFTNAVANIPDAMANATLAGLNPVHGLYSLVVGTPVASLTTSSKLMTVAVTGSMALVVADALSGVPADQRAIALISLTLLVGIIQIVLGVLRAGTLVRFVSNSVMRGFLTGVAINIVLSQVADVTGYKSALTNKSMRLIDTALQPRSVSVPTVLLALLTVAIILGIGRTRLATFAFPIALVASTLAANVANVGIAMVGDSASIPSALPKLVLPQLNGMLNLLVPALSVAIVGLIQGAGISKAVPNPGGVYSDINRDFIGQGAGNAAAAFFGGMPVGASLSSTALNVQLGGRHRVANFIIGPIIAVVLLLLAPAVELIPRAALGAMLVVIGVRAIDAPAIRAVWQTSVQTRTIMLVTFIGTLVVPVQYAVLIGVALSVVQYTFSSSLDARVVTLTRDEQGNHVEGEAPAKLPDDSVTVLDVYGSVFYAGTDVIDRLLPDAIGAHDAVVVLRLRGRADVGSTFLELIRRYSAQVAEGGGYLALVGIGPALLDQLERTGAADSVGRGHIYAAQPALMASVDEAVTDAEAWLESKGTSAG